jgi:NADPH-dependent 2,4-dienoyl-CoA reductase/sulfur reductase-like enzyme
MNQESFRRGRVLRDWPLAESPTAVQMGAVPYDVAVVGAGVVGCALAYKLSRFRLRVILIDKNIDVGDCLPSTRES